MSDMPEGVTQVVAINGREYDVIEWSHRESDVDGEGMERWELFCRKVNP